MNKEKMTSCIETDRLVLFPYTGENLHLFNTDLPRFEETFGVIYRGEELDHLLKGFLEKLEKEIAEDEEHYLFFTEFLIVLKENDHVIGSIDYKYVPRDGVTEVGYGMNPAYTGHGYMTEALAAFLAFGKQLGITVVRADTEPDNTKSQNVLKRCGFTYLYEKGNLWWEIDLNDSLKTIRVAAAVILDNDRIFAVQRGYGAYKDWWEFPGGKIEPGETPEEALIREIREELETEITVEKLIVTVEYDYPEFHLSMDCFLCSITGGSLTLTEAEDSAWLTRETIYSVKWLPADLKIMDQILAELGQ